MFYDFLISFCLYFSDCVFFFMQKTAYEMRISDWSSDVCSSDLGNVSTMPRRGIVVSYCLGWLKPFELQWLVYPPQVARRFPPALAALVGYAQHRPNLGNVEGQCPSILLRDDVPEHLAAIDALRPDQAESAEMVDRKSTRQNS